MTERIVAGGFARAFNHASYRPIRTLASWTEEAFSGSELENQRFPR